MMGKKSTAAFFSPCQSKWQATRKPPHTWFSGIDLIVGLDWLLERDFNCGGDSLEMEHQTFIYITNTQTHRSSFSESHANINPSCKNRFIFFCFWHFTAGWRTNIGEKRWKHSHQSCVCKDSKNQSRDCDGQHYESTYYKTLNGRKNRLRFIWQSLPAKRDFCFFSFILVFNRGGGGCLEAAPWIISEKSSQSNFQPLSMTLCPAPPTPGHVKMEINGHLQGVHVVCSFRQSAVN